MITLAADPTASKGAGTQTGPAGGPMNGAGPAKPPGKTGPTGGGDLDIRLNR